MAQSEGTGRRPARLTGRTRVQPLATRLLGLAWTAGLLAASTVVSAQAVLRLPHHFVQTESLLPSGSLPVLRAPSQSDGEQSSPVASETTPERASDAGSSRATPPRSGRLTKKDYNESWRQAGPGPDGLGRTLRSHQVLVGVDGRLSGRIETLERSSGRFLPLANVEVPFLRAGQVVALATTDESGRFMVDGLTTGTHAVIVRSSSAVLAFGVHVLAETDEHRSFSGPDMKSELVLECLAVPEEDTRAVLSWIDSSFVADHQPAHETEPALNEVPTELHELRQQGVPGTPVVSHAAQLQADGRLIGRIRRLHAESGRSLVAAGALVAVFHEGHVIATTLTDDLGCFALRDVKPGLYSLVATLTSHDEDAPPAGLDRTDDTLVSVRRDGPTASGFAALQIKVLAAALPRADFHAPRGQGDAEEPLEIDVALADVHGFLQYTNTESLTDTTAVSFGATSPTSSGGVQPGSAVPQAGRGVGAPAVGAGPSNGLIGPLVVPMIDDPRTTDNPISGFML